jgi:hypothetical protein
VIEAEVPRAGVSWEDPFGSEPEGWQPDLAMPAIFLIAASFILGFINPIHLAYAPRLIETLVAVGLVSLVVGWGLWRGVNAVVLAGCLSLITLIALSVGTQPYVLGLPLAEIWPLRALLVALVAGSALVLLRPPLWATRALVGLAIVSVPVAICAGGPLLIVQLAPIKPPPTPLFSPYWLAADSTGRVYAAASGGGPIMIISPEGVPLGTIRPHVAPGVGQPGERFRPIGYPSPTPQLHRSGPLVAQPIDPPFTYCGLAIDHLDRLYVVDPTTLELLRMRTDGTVERRVKLPDDFQGARGCLAADSERLYVSSRYGIVYIMNHDGEIEREVELEYLPFSLSADRQGNVLVVAPTFIDRINAETGAVETLPYPPAEPGDARAPYQALVVTQDGSMLVNDLANARVLRLAPDGGALLGMVGRPGSVQTGFLPGTFSGLGGLAQGPDGRIYVADSQLGAIQRFSPDGRLEAVISTPAEAAPAPIGGEEEY